MSVLLLCLLGKCDVTAAGYLNLTIKTGNMGKQQTATY